MTDIQQWRRMIQPARSRTPAVETDDSDGFQSPTTTRRGLKPKFSSYFSQYASPIRPSQTDVELANGIFSTDISSCWVNNATPDLDAERLVDSVMSRLLAEPYKNLDIRCNGLLLEIFESYRNISDDRKQLLSRLQKETERCSTAEHAMHELSRQWEFEKQEYRGEIKRLELLLAKGKRGLAEVTLARQDSVLRYQQQYRSAASSDETLETIFEFLERTKRYEDKMWSSQRATMRKRPTSPSAAMRKLSSTPRDISTISNAHSELRPDRPTDKSRCEGARRNLARHQISNTNTALLREAAHHDDLDTNLATSEPRRSFSDDTPSTFSCTGGLLPDEGANVNLIRVAGMDNDFVAIKRIAQALARRRHVDPDSIMPTLRELFGAQFIEPSVEKEGNSSLPNGLGIQLPRTTSIAAERSLAETNFAKHPRLRTKASERIATCKPQLHIDTPATSRRFSFVPGDDTDAYLSAALVDNLPATVKDRLLRKSVSLSFLSEVASSKKPQPELALSPVQQSPTTSAPPSDGRRLSRIPTPVYSNGSLARPRQQREDSASSLLTAIRHADEVCQRSDSLSSSSFSPPSVSHTDLTQDAQNKEVGRPSVSRTAVNPLLEHTNVLRGNAFAVAAAKAAGTVTTNADHGNLTASAHDKRQKVPVTGNNGRSSTRSRMVSDAREPRKENSQPMIP